MILDRDGYIIAELNVILVWWWGKSQLYKGVYVAFRCGKHENDWQVNMEILKKEQKKPTGNPVQDGRSLGHICYH